MDLQVKSYDYIGHEKAPRSIGFIAQEVEKIFPDLVYDMDGMKGLGYDNFAILAIKSIQEQQVIIEPNKRKLGN